MCAKAARRLLAFHAHSRPNLEKGLLRPFNLIHKEAMMSFELPPLDYAYDALAPHISARTMEFHHDKHHKAYVDKLNKLVQDSPLARLSLEEVMRKTADDPSKRAVFNNAAQAWNHAFYWNCLTPDRVLPTGMLAKAIDTAFGSLDNLCNQFTEAALARFGSGWTWLVKNDDGTLEIASTANANNPLPEGKVPLLVCDVWEHAYYIDYRHQRAAYLQGFWNIVNWAFVTENFSRDASDLRVA